MKLFDLGVVICSCSSVTSHSSSITLIKPWILCPNADAINSALCLASETACSIASLLKVISKYGKTVYYETFTTRTDSHTNC